MIVWPHPPMPHIYSKWTVKTTVNFAFFFTGAAVVAFLVYFTCIIAIDNLGSKKMFACRSNKNRE